METKETKETKEINLLQLIAIFFNWLKNVVIYIIKVCGYFLRLLYRHWLVTLIVLLLAVGFGQYLTRPSVRKYKAGAIALLYGSDAQTVKDVCSQLQNSISTSKVYSLSTKLNLPDSVARNIQGIKSFDVIDYLKDNVADVVDFKRTHSLTDTLNVKMKDRIYIQVTTLNISQLPLVQNALIEYFNNNSVLKNEYDVQKTGLEDKIKFIDKELNRIDSLAKVSYFRNDGQNISMENNKLLIGEQKKQLFWEDLMKLQQDKIYTQKFLVLFKHPVDFPSGLVVNPAPVNGRIKYGVYSLAIGLCIALLLSVLIENLGKIREYLNKK